MQIKFANSLQSHIADLMWDAKDLEMVKKIIAVYGKEVRFVTVGPEDKLFSQDGWDGEMCVHRPLGDVPGVDHMVIYHQW